jgi:hypothetical protein
MESMDTHYSFFLVHGFSQPDSGCPRLLPSKSMDTHCRFYPGWVSARSERPNEFYSDCVLPNCRTDCSINRNSSRKLSPGNQRLDPVHRDAIGYAALCSVHSMEQRDDSPHRHAISGLGRSLDHAEAIGITVLAGQGNTRGTASYGRIGQYILYRISAHPGIFRRRRLAHRRHLRFDYVYSVFDARSNDGFKSSLRPPIWAQDSYPEHSPISSFSYVRCRPHSSSFRQSCTAKSAVNQIECNGGTACTFLGGAADALSEMETRPEAAVSRACLQTADFSGIGLRRSFGISSQGDHRADKCFRSGHGAHGHRRNPCVRVPPEPTDSESHGQRRHSSFIHNYRALVLHSSSGFLVIRSVSFTLRNIQMKGIRLC